MSLRNLPKVHTTLQASQLDGIRSALGLQTVTALTREVIARWRTRVQAGAEAPSVDVVAEEVVALAGARRRAGIQRVVNATGVLLHTNLGRAPLPAASLARLSEVAGSYNSLEFDVESGTRTRRGLAAERNLALLAQAEDSLIVNNNAAAVLLAISTLCAGKEVLVSRGELLEIGGGFRIPDILARSGARLVEVGTTNRTRRSDYQAAITGNTACILRVHPSNFEMRGYVERPSLSELAELSDENGLVLIKDLGGGLFHDLPAPSAAPEPRPQVDEPSVQACLRAGAHVVCFSLDKLFGGPQGGAIVGHSAVVQRLRSDALARALRVDKLTLIALEPVLEAHLRGEPAELPIYAALSRTAEALKLRVEAWRSAVNQQVPTGVTLGVEESTAAIGGGTLAGYELPSVALKVQCASPEKLAAAFRRAEPALVGRVAQGAVWLDARTVAPEDDEALCAALGQMLRGYQD